ncbi:MAG TPA: LysM peptidoglycan-binding domain-containing protein [Fibrobacteria bacterium]|nr:LysM peptidoglycan-binding domain-containing protein [Fibrobacteria bacterium]
MRRGAITLLALLFAAVAWTGCASSARSTLGASPALASEPVAVARIRRLLDTGMQLQAQGLYAQSQEVLSNAMSDLSVLDTSVSASGVRGLTQQVLGAMRSNLPYSLEPDIVEEPGEDEEDGAAILDSIPDTTAMAPLDSATAASLRKEAMADSTSTFDLPVEINDLVLMNLRVFKDQIPQHFARWLERKGRWEGYITQQLQAHGMPKDLLYLAMVESGFNPHATSPAAAAGIWQFIPGTGRKFGLRIDRFVDERRDPWKSTQAAIVYLSSLYQEFGDWRLAMAAYNCGENCVERAIRRSGVNDYWRIGLPRETRNYVPRIFAAAILAKNPKAHGFEVQPWAPVLADTFTVQGGYTFSQIGQALGVQEDSLGLLNPALVRGTTPPVHDNWLLNLPQGTRSRFADAYASLEPSFQAPQPQRYVHRVRRKETLAGIAARYGVSVSDIRRWNKIRGRKVRGGRTLVIWGDCPAGSGLALAEPPLAKRGEGIPEPSHQLSHKIRRGESIASIARVYDVTTDELKDWNGLSGARLRPGHRIWVSAPTVAERDAIAELKLPKDTASEKVVAGTDVQDSAPSVQSATPDGPFRHRVQWGESLDKIGRRYGVTAEQIRKWNRLASDRVVPGTRLWIGGDDPDAPSTGPVAKTKVSQARFAARGPEQTHIVRQGETLGAIAEQYAVAASTVRSLNHLRSSRIDVGQKLVLPATAVAQAAPATTTPRYSTRFLVAAKLRTASYVVRLGDSLYSIAMARATTVDTLMELNGLTRSKLKPGQVILVPLASAQ